MPDTPKTIVRYRAEDLKTWWPAKCLQCGWRGLSRDCEGGHALADGGDFDESYCPVCWEAAFEKEGRPGSGAIAQDDYDFEVIPEDQTDA